MENDSKTQKNRPTVADVRDVPHVPYVDGKKKDFTLAPERIRTFVHNLRLQGKDFHQDAEGAICVENRRYVPVQNGDECESVIHEVGWHLRKAVTRDAYRRDLAYAHEQGLEVHQWRGEDRDGHPVTVAWVATPSGRLLAAYEIQGRA